MTAITFDLLIKRLVLASLVLIGAAGVYSARGLYSDGSFWLMEMLPRGGFYIFDIHRAYAQILVQAPVALAIWLNVVDLNTLIRIHSFGFVGIPLIFWLAALAIHIRTKLFWFFLIGFTVSYLRSNFFAAGEFSTAYALTAFCTAILLKERVSTWLLVCMLFSAIVLIHSYEATVFLGGFLASLTVLRIVKQSTDTKAVKISLGLALVCFLISFYTGAKSTFFDRPYDGQGTANLGAFTQLHFLYLLCMPALLAITCINRNRRINAVLGIFCVVISMAYLGYTFRWDQSQISFGYQSYAYRALCCFLLLGSLLLAVIFHYKPAFLRLDRPSSIVFPLSIGTAAFFISLALPLLFHTYGFYKWAQRFEAEALAITRHTHIDHTRINTNHGWTHGYNWMWGNPSTSILLRGNAEAIILNNSTHAGFDPVDHKTIARDPLQPISNSTKSNGQTTRYVKRSLLFP